MRANNIMREENAQLLRVAIAVMKHHGQKQVGEKRVYLACTYILLLLLKSGQELKQGGEGIGDFWRGY